MIAASKRAEAFTPTQSSTALQGGTNINPTRNEFDDGNLYTRAL